MRELETLFDEPDPLDLSVYAAYRRGIAALESDRRVPVRIEYLGINDEWLALCERHFRAPYTLRHIAVPFTPVERRHFELLQEVAPDAVSALGPQSVGLLRAGYKVELEGAINPELYGPRFLAALRRHLLQKARQSRRRRRAMGPSGRR